MITEGEILSKSDNRNNDKLTEPKTQSFRK